MPRTVFLTSSGLGALPDVLDDHPAVLQLLYIPTAANVEQPAPWEQASRDALAEFGFQIDDLDIADALRTRVEQAVAAADVVYVGGGNTYYLLHQMNESGFRDALRRREDIVYAGASAGAIVACNDISYIGGEIDDPSLAPELSSTRGLGLVDHVVVPHVDNAEFAAGIERLVLPDDSVMLRDDQALVVRDGIAEVVVSA